MWNIEDYLSTKGQDPPNNQQAKVYLFYKPSIFYTHFEHLNMLEEKQSRKLRVRVLMSRWEKWFSVKFKLEFEVGGVVSKGNGTKFELEGDFVASIWIRVIRI